MAARGVKRKLPSQEPTLSASPCSASPLGSGKLVEASADLESSEDSTQSYLSDAASRATAQEDVELVARVLSRVAAKSPEAICQFVRRLTPAKVARSLDWDLLESDRLRKVTTAEILVFHLYFCWLNLCA